jgi:hypothetical protein
VLAALAAGVEAGEDEAAREVLRHADWVLRAPAQRELSRALIDAALICGVYGTSDRECVRHIHRVAALNLAKRYEVDVTNREDVALAYATMARPALPRAPMATIAATCVVAVSVLLLVWLAITVRTPSRPERPPTPLVTGAYFHGGAPARDDVLEKFIVTELTDLVIETDAERRGSSEGAPREKHAAELRNAPLIAQRGPALATAWRELIDALERWTHVRTTSRQYRQVEAELGRRAQAMNDQFAALGLGIYLQADVMVDRGVPHAAIFTFSVADVAFVRAGGEARRVLSLRRLDELNLRHTLLGRQGDEIGDPVVLLDSVDELVRERVMYAYDGYRYPLGDSAWRTTIYGAGIAAQAGEAIRRELEVALGYPTDRNNFARATTDVSRLITASVRRHEARHGIDRDRESPLRYPKQLAAYVKNDGSLISRRAAAELSAYLSQIGNDPATPQFALWNLASLTFNRERWHSAEFYVGVVIVEGLSRQLGIPPLGPALRHDAFDRQLLVAVAEPLAAQSSEKLRAAARQLWIELYGEPMLPIVDLLR